MKNMASSRPSGRFFYWLIAVICMVTMARATGPVMTTISDVVYRANGQPASGTIVVSWPAFNTADNKPVAAGELSIAIGAQGTVNFALVPNEGGDPGGTFYKAVYKLGDGTTYTEYWVVPAASPTTIAAIRATVVPRQVGAQFVNRQYVDTAITNTNQQAVHKTGSESIEGVKTFAASPEVPEPLTGAAAVNKDYVTAQVTALSGGFVDKLGDEMIGPLTLPNDPTAPGHATNRLYVDQQISDVIAGQVLKLGRLNDTPISLASVKYASQYSSPGAGVSAQVNAACADFSGATGTVMVPSEMAGTALRSQIPDHCHIYDQRRVAAPNEFGTESPAFLKGIVHRFRWTAPNSDTANGSPSTNQTFQGLQVFIDSAKGGINNGTLGATTKSNYRTANFTLNASTPGQHTALEGVCAKFSAGDCLGVAGIAEMWGGSRPGFGDEGAVPLTARMLRGTTIFFGTVAAKSGNTLTFSGTLNHQSLGAGARWLINKTTGVYSAGTAQFAVGQTTVTGTDTLWTSLADPSSYCFSLDAEEVNGSKVLIPVVSVTDDTHLGLMTAPGSGITTTAGNYKLFRCSEVAEVETDKTGTTPLTAPTATLVNAANFNVGDIVELPVSHLWSGEAVKIVIAPHIATTQSTVGLGISNGSSGASRQVANAISVGGNFRRGIEFNNNSVQLTYGILWQAGPAPSILFGVSDTQDTATIVHTAIGRRSATGGEARFTYLNSTDQWMLGNNTGGLYHFKSTGPNMGIGTVGLAGTALHIVPAGTDNGVTIGGNATGHLLNAQVGSVTRFLVNGTQAQFSNGLDVRGYSDNLTTQRWQITGSSGKANFNGGICQDNAQTLCETSGSGAPSGACVTGSTYKRTDGGTASTLYVCESAGWVAVGGSGSSLWSGIGNPTGAQALSMAANNSTWTWNAATGANVDLFKLIDTANNTGTGHMLSVETAASSNAKPFQVKSRGTVALEVNEAGAISTLGNVTTSSGLTIQAGGQLLLKGRDDWFSPVILSGSDFSGTTSTGGSVTVRSGDVVASTGANTGGGLLLRSGGVASASGSPGILQVAQTYLKDTSVTSGYLQCFKAAAAMTVGDCGNSALNSVGVAISTSNTNPVIVQFQGIATLQFDASASPSAGWFACSSNSAGGKVTVQSAACAAGRQVGIVAQNGTSITSGKVFLQSR